MRPYLIQMGVWCASATDVQPRERKTGCAWTDDRESYDASTRRRFGTPLDKGPVNGCPVSVHARSSLASHSLHQCVCSGSGLHITGRPKDCLPDRFN